MFVSAIIVAAGKGERLGGKISKQFLEIDGRPILALTLEKFQLCSLVDEIIIVTKDDYIDFCKKIIDDYGFHKVSKIVKGGKRRQDSVYNGLKFLKEQTDIVLIHDGVRPFIDPGLIENFIYEVETHHCCVLGVPSKDTIKVCDEKNFIIDTPDRRSLWSVQTPQGFKHEIILNVHKQAENEDFEATDDGFLVEKFGNKVKMVMGNYFNIKITTKEDLLFAKSILKFQIIDEDDVPYGKQ